MIAAKVANALALDYPRELLEVIVACDGCADRTAELARAAGADLVLELPRAGKVPAQNAAVERAARRAARVQRRERALAARRAARAGGAVRRPERSATSAARRACSTRAAPTRRALYWRYELAVRELESALAGVTAGNGAIYAVRASAYLALGPAASHDLSFPFMLTKRGLRAVYAPAAVAEEKMVATNEGEFARKRRMMRGHLRRGRPRRDALAARLPAGLRLADRQPPGLRYASPLLHLIALGTNLVAARPGHRLRGHARGAAAAAGRARRSPGRCRSRRCGSRATTC